jgi:ribosomal protein L16 Arg81 hydroxylase
LVKEGTVNEGEMMYVPQNWWHSVLNLDDSLAITQNFVDLHNLKDVLKFCKYKSDQVSGYKGELHKDFVKVLKEKEPGIVDKLDPKLLEPRVERKRRWDVMVEETREFSFDFNTVGDIQSDQDRGDLKEE